MHRIRFAVLGLAGLEVSRGTRRVRLERSPTITITITIPINSNSNTITGTSNSNSHRGGVPDPVPRSGAVGIPLEAGSVRSHEGGAERRGGRVP